MATVTQIYDAATKVMRTDEGARIKRVQTVIGQRFTKAVKVVVTVTANGKVVDTRTLEVIPIAGKEAALGGTFWLDNDVDPAPPEVPDVVREV